MRLLFLLFIILPIAELMLLFKVGQLIGAFPTIALVLVTAAAGVRILKQQSFRTLGRAQQRLQAGELPGRELVEGFFIAIGGTLLLTPGFITDVFAIVLLLPWSRRALVAWLFTSGKIQALGSRGATFTFTTFGSGGPPRPGTTDVYEGEFTREDAGKPSLRKPDQD